MAGTKASGSGAKAAAFEAAYKAALIGKPLSQGAVNKVYKEELERANEPAAAAEKENSQITGKMTPKQTRESGFGSNSQIEADTRTTQQKFDDAQTAYDRYLASNEYKQKLDKVGGRLMRDDAKAKELNATVEHYRQQLQAEEDQRVMDADLKELENWSEEDRKNLEQYVRVKDQQALLATNPISAIHFTSESFKNPIVDKYGYEKVSQMAETSRRSKNAELMEMAEKSAKKFAGDGFLSGTASSIVSVPANLVGGVSGTLGYLDEALQGTGRYSTLDPNNRGNLLSVFGQTVRSEVAQNIRGDEESTNWLRKLAALGYQGGMSAIDSAARIAASGGSSTVASVIAASGAFSNGMRQYSQQGASPEQAAAMALTSAGLEYITEKIPTDNVLDMFKKGNNTGVVRNILKQAFLVEPTSEEVNLFAGVAAEAAILGNKSDAQKKIGEMVANGMSYEEARAQYYKGLWSEALQTYAVSAFSGLASSGGAAIVGNAVNNSQQTETQQQAAPAAPVVDDKTQAQQVIENTASELAQKAPAPEPAQPMTENQQHMDNGVAETIRQVEEASSIKDQIRSSQDVLNKQSPVASINTPKGFAEMTKTERKDWVIKKLQPTNYEVDRKGFGIIKFAEKQLKSAFNYLKRGSVEEAAFEALPYVLENGTEISAHPKHKGREYGTVTIAAPVVINGKRGNMAVIVKQTTDNFYKVHRILTPEGSVFNLSETTNEAGSSLAGESPETGSLATPINPASNNIIQSAEAEVKGTGAAEQNFSGKAQYQDLLYEGNVQRDRPGDVRPMEVPKTDANGNPVSAVAANTYGSKYTTDDLASETESSISKGELSYMQISNETAGKKAAKTIENAGNWDDAYIQWHDAVRDGKTSAEMAARGAMLLNHAAEVYEQVKATGDATAEKEAKQKWISILLDVRALGTNTAQGLQAMRMIRELAPPDKMDFAVATVKRMVSNMRLQTDVQIDEKLLNEYRAAETDEQRDEILGRIQQNVADQIPSTLLDKWTALRYTNMLGNLKTQVRNFAGNVGSMVAYRMKDQVAAGIEDVISLFNKNYKRQKAHVVSRKYLQFAKDDFNSFRGAVNNGGKYSERMAADGEFEQGIVDKRRIFKSNAENQTVKKIGDFVLAPMEGYRRATNWLMNNKYFGDEAFGRAAYARALAGYLKSNGVKDSDLSNVDPKLLDQARAYAVKEAQEATFKDNSALAQVAGKLQKATGVVGQGVMPFTKTPANVLTRAVEFSPAGILDTAVKSAKAIAGSENVTGADVVNSLAKTLTGTGLVALGALLWDQGLLSGGPDDDDEKEQFDQMNGEQNYALQFQDRDGEMHSYTFDWLTPVVIPMFMGAELWKAVTETDGEATFADYADLFTAIADPMVQMSMLQGLNDSLDGIKYADSNLGQFFINSTVSYLTQGLTNTLLGQIERSTEENRQTTFVDKDSNVPQWLQTQLGKASQKIPGWDYQQTEYRNAWGETEENEGGLLYNLLSPGYLSKEEATAVSNELYRLRESTGENVFPQRPEKNLTYTDKNGERHENYNLTAEEYDTMQRAEGQTAARIIGDLTSDADYATLTDAQKAKVIGFAYDYAREQGRVDAIADYKGNGESWMKNISGKEAKAIVNKVVTADLSDAIGAMVGAWKDKKPDAEAKAELDTAYQVYSSMSKNAQKEVLENATGRLEYYLKGRKAGVDAETFTDLYKKYWDISESRMKASEKAQRWAYDLELAQEAGTITAAQKNTLKDSMTFFQTIPAEAAKFDELTAGSLTATDAQNVVRTVNNLLPEEGNSTVSYIQKLDAIAKMTLGDLETEAAMRAYMTDQQEAKLDEVKDLGFDAEDYPEIYRIVDAYTSGTGKKARTIKHMQEVYGIDYAAAKKLYEVFK